MVIYDKDGKRNKWVQSWTDHSQHIKFGVRFQRQRAFRMYLMSESISSDTPPHIDPASGIYPPKHQDIIPAAWERDLESILIPETSIQRRVDELGALIERDYADKNLTLVALLNGTALFLADLIRRLSLPVRLDFMGISSYRDQTVGGEIIMTKQLQLDLSGSDVLIVDDILDSGATLKKAVTLVESKSPASLKTCVLLEKPARRSVNISADYTGFTIPDEFVVGYGLDYADLYRNLPFIGALHPRVYNHTSN